MPNTLYCPLRKIQVASLPEEKIRQALIHEMTLHLGYPLGSLAIEKSLSQLPHILSKYPFHTFPKRRADLIVFAKDLHPQHPIYPLLLIECKAVPLTDKVLRQIIGYNQYVGAYFIAAVNQTKTIFGWYDSQSQDFSFQEGLPTYTALLEKALDKK